MKNTINNKEVKKNVNSNSAKVQKREKSVDSYLDSIRSKYSKVMAIRVDLEVKGEYQTSTTTTDVADNVSKMLKNKRSNNTVFGGMIGYVYLVEEGKNSKANNPHAHFIGLFDGQKLKNDKYKSMQIGEYWSNTIMKGEGKYNSCNANKKYYKDYSIGTLEHKDDEKWEKFKNVAHYLCKDTQEPTDTNGSVRYFKRGVVPKKNTKKGRPRGKRE